MTLAPNPDDGLRIRAADRLRNVANLMLVRGMERRRQTSLSIAWARELREVSSRSLRAPAIPVRRGSGAGDCICGRTPLASRVSLAARLAEIPISASPSWRYCCSPWELR